MSQFIPQEKAERVLFELYDRTFLSKLAAAGYLVVTEPDGKEADALTPQKASAGVSEDLITYLDNLVDSGLKQPEQDSVAAG